MHSSYIDLENEKLVIKIDKYNIFLFWKYNFNFKTV